MPFVQGGAQIQETVIPIKVTVSFANRFADAVQKRIKEIIGQSIRPSDRIIKNYLIDNSPFLQVDISKMIDRVAWQIVPGNSVDAIHQQQIIPRVPQGFKPSKRPDFIIPHKSWLV